MRFRPDPAKAASNLKKHGISFADAEGVLQDPLAITVEDPDAEGEQRFITVGLGSAGEFPGGGMDGAQRRMSCDLGAPPDTKGTKTV